LRKAPRVLRMKSIFKKPLASKRTVTRATRNQRSRAVLHAIQKVRAKPVSKIEDELVQKAMKK
jgi:hypothetical protein